MKALGRSQALALGLACAAYAALLLWTAPKFSLLDADELTHARAALEASRDGHWFPLTVGGQAWAEKPPLLIWMTAALYRVLGPTELATRIWPGLFAALALGLGALLALDLGAPLGLAAAGALALAFSRDWLYHARFLSMDMPMLAAGLGALLFARRQRYWAAGACLALIAAFKSWFAFAWALPFVLDLYGRSGSHRRAALAALLLPLTAVLLLWLGASSAAYGAGFWRQAFVHEIVGRFSGEGHPSSAPPWRFYPAWSRAFFPISLACAAACVGRFLRAPREALNESAGAVWLFLLAWGAGLALVKVTVFHYFLPWGTLAVLLWTAQARGLKVWAAWAWMASALWMTWKGMDGSTSHGVLALGLLPALAAGWAADTDRPASQSVLVPGLICALALGWSYLLSPPDPNGPLIQALREREPRGPVAVLGRYSQAPAFYGPWETSFFGPEAPPPPPFIDAASGRWTEKLVK